ncbi:uncharacterized protein LOC132286466 [Cornus florida]|uniref:uncharacterized protein LOC132286466 n=1 Tax=Cornus florida TaxID=4283 RepID=UPI0028A136FA|nr:uncharacterized protein LOC132286466 [Cornus florida]
MSSEGGEFSHFEHEEMATEMFIAKRRCCFCIPRFGSNRLAATIGRNWWQRMRPAEIEEGWWARGIGVLKKLREWSEIVAGPRWKTFIRRFNRNRSLVGGGGGGRNAKFQYDPLSYALNFDQGPGQNGNSDEDGWFRNFSTRYSPVPASAKIVDGYRQGRAEFQVSIEE